MPTQRKQYCFLVVNVIITTTLVVIKTQLLLQMLNGDDLNSFQNGFDQAGKKDFKKPMLYPFCIANNAV